MLDRDTSAPLNLALRDSQNSCVGFHMSYGQFGYSHIIPTRRHNYTHQTQITLAGTLQNPQFVEYPHEAVLLVFVIVCLFPCCQIQYNVPAAETVGCGSVFLPLSLSPPASRFENCRRFLESVQGGSGPSIPENPEIITLRSHRSHKDHSRYSR